MRVCRIIDNVRGEINKRQWIIFDGDVDPEWVESLNSVLDDNRLLTMPSGERIQFGPNVNFLFETHDLSCASPATISRMGMIFLRFFISFFKYRMFSVCSVMKIQISKLLYNLG